MEQDGSGETIGNQFPGVAVSVEEVGDGVTAVPEDAAQGYATIRFQVDSYTLFYRM